MRILSWAILFIGASLFLAPSTLASSWIDREDAVGSENLAIEIEDDQKQVLDSERGQAKPDAPTVSPGRAVDAINRPPSNPIQVPCQVLLKGTTIPFEENKDKIINLLRDISQGWKDPKGAPSDSVLGRQSVCPVAAMSEIQQLIKAISDPLPLEESSETLRSMAMTPQGFERLGQDCAIDIIVLSDLLHRWGSELQALHAAVQHASENCMQAWAHFLAFIDRSGALTAPLFRSEKCIFVDEYRKCFDF